MNNNITEDYCSFEVSKLLKEKGFDSDATREVYKIDGSARFCLVTNKYIDDTVHFNGVCLKPTHALAIKWIRENFGIHIHIHSEVKLNGLKITNISKYQAGIVRLNTAYTFGKKSKYDIPDGDFRKPKGTPEEATEAALLYTLQNLIP